MNLRLSARRAMILGIGLLLLALVIGAGSRLMSGKGEGTEDSSALEKQKSPVTGDAALASDASGRPARQVWRRTVESAAAGLTANEDAPVRIGFVQTSPDLRRWRVSLLRTPAAGEVLDSGKLTIRVDSLASPDDAETNNRDDMAVEWETQGRSFEEAAAPRLNVTAEKPLSHVRFSIFYDGTEIERRTFSATGGN